MSRSATAIGEVDHFLAQLPGARGGCPAPSRLSRRLDQPARLGARAFHEPPLLLGRFLERGGADGLRPRRSAAWSFGGVLLAAARWASARAACASSSDF